MYILDLIGTLAFAIAGAFKAKERNLNIIAVVLLGAAPAVGGGTFRDLIIGRTPLFYLKDPNYLLLTVIGGVATYFVPHFFKKRFSFFRFLDSIGLAAFSIIGTSVSFNYLFKGEFQGLISILVCVPLGVITAAGGGILRNALMGDLAGAFTKKSNYLTASFAGAFSFFLLMFVDIDLATFVSIFLTLSVREILAEHGVYKKIFRKKFKVAFALLENK